MRRRLLCLAAFVLTLGATLRAEIPPVEQQPADPKAAKIVLVAGSNYYKAGEHEYVAGCAVLYDLLRQNPGVAPVLVIDWPKKPETFAGARAVVFLFDGGDKHGLLKEDRLAQVQKLIDSGVGLVQMHQVADYPTDLGSRARNWAGGAFEKGYSQRAHWVSKFDQFPDHPIFRGVQPFTIDDGWLYKIRFAEGKNGVTPLLRTVSPKATQQPSPDESTVAWAFERPTGGRSFTFTGMHLHSSFEQPGYRTFLTNGILWAAGVEIPEGGAKADVEVKALSTYLAKPPATSKKK